MTTLVELTMQELVLRVARGTIGAQEIGVNDGAFVRRVQKRTGNKPPDAWCCSFINDVGCVALGEDTWPVPLSGRVQHVVDWAEKKGCLYDPTHVGIMQPASLFVLWYPSLNRYAHIGFVDVRSTTHARRIERTIEGNTSDPANKDPEKQRVGWLVGSKPRTLGPRDRIIRWWEAL